MSFTTRMFFAASLASLAFGFGCSSSDSGDPPFNFPDAPSYCVGRAKAECSDAVLGACLTTVDSCVVTAQAACGKELQSGKYRPNAADTCIASVKEAYVDGKVTGTEKAKYTKDCNLLFGGTGAAGATCKSNLDCNLDASLQCVVKTGKTDGTCQVPEEVTVGKACSGSAQICAASLYCGADDACIDKKELGAECTATKPCKDTLQCLTNGTTSQCAAKTGTGQSCTADIECTDNICLETSSTSKQCASAIILSPSEPTCKRFK